MTRLIIAVLPKVDFIRTINLLKWHTLGKGQSNYIIARMRTVNSPGSLPAPKLQ